MTKVICDGTKYHLAYLSKRIHFAGLHTGCISTSAATCECYLTAQEMIDRIVELDLDYDIYDLLAFQELDCTIPTEWTDSIAAFKSTGEFTPHITEVI